MSREPLHLHRLPPAQRAELERKGCTLARFRERVELHMHRFGVPPVAATLGEVDADILFASLWSAGTPELWIEGPVRGVIHVDGVRIHVRADLEVGAWALLGPPPGLDPGYGPALRGA